jgi:hypothetical protein
MRRRPSPRAASPAAVELSVALRIHDAALAANSGPRILQVSSGQDALTPYETASGPHLPSAAPVRIGASGLAALYGGVPVATLRRAGLVADGDPDADAALGGAFAGPAFMADDSERPQLLSAQRDTPGPMPVPRGRAR